ncbi:MAG: glycosyltransferase family 2 protein [Fermentimonas sp.]
MKTLSVITVTYNAENTLPRTMKSVSEQTYDGIEHIIVDGRSKDGTVELIEQYDREGLTWISEPDSGLYDAMNKGIDMAKGDYLCFLNAGDAFYSKDTVANFMKQIDSEGITPDIIYGETAIIDNNGKFLRMRRLKAPKRLSWKSFKNGMVVCHQAFIVNRRMVNHYDLKYRFSSDVDWCIRMMKQAEVIYNTNMILINYLSEGITTDNHKASLKERYSIMVEHYGWASTFAHHLWFALRAIIKK